MTSLRKSPTELAQVFVHSGSWRGDFFEHSLFNGQGEKTPLALFQLLDEKHGLNISFIALRGTLTYSLHGRSPDWREAFAAGIILKPSSKWFEQFEAPQEEKFVLERSGHRPHLEEPDEHSLVMAQILSGINGSK